MAGEVYSIVEGREELKSGLEANKDNYAVASLDSPEEEWNQFYIGEYEGLIDEVDGVSAARVHYSNDTGHVTSTRDMAEAIVSKGEYDVFEIKIDAKRLEESISDFCHELSSEYEPEFKISFNTYPSYSVEELQDRIDERNIQIFFSETEVGNTILDPKRQRMHVEKPHSLLLDTGSIELGFNEEAFNDLRNMAERNGLDFSSELPSSDYYKDNIF